MSTVAIATPAAVLAQESDFVDYTREAYDDALASGKPFMLGFLTPWWGTCRAQERTVSALRKGNSKYHAVTFMKVDWDLHRGDVTWSSILVHKVKRY